MMKQVSAKFYILFCITWLLPLISYSMTMSVDKIKNTSTYALKFEGRIVEGDFNKMIKIIKEKKQLPAWVNISSQGGSATEAIKIAEFIREALIPVNAIDRCDSSCFYIWIASVERNVFSKDINYEASNVSEIENAKVIGLHRPYYDKEYLSRLSREQKRDKYKELESLVRDFLKKMNVSEKWIDEMMMHSSEQIKLVTYREIAEEFGFTSHSFEEWIMVKCSIDEEALLFGKAELIIDDKTGRSDWYKGELSKEQRNELKMKYTNYISCKNQAVKTSQAETLYKLMQ